jgi:hypothetical protein
MFRATPASPSGKNGFDRHTVKKLLAIEEVYHNLPEVVEQEIPILQPLLTYIM